MTANFLIAAPHSGCGKTIVTAGLIRAFTQQGKIVQPYKVGPDYIDPTYHSLAAHRPCRNLDIWMLGADAVRQSYGRNLTNADVGIVEGVLGLFDGYGATSEGSSAAVAKLLNLPVILLINARGMANSASALVHGYNCIDPDLKLSGVILNQVGSERHAQLCTEAIERDTAVPVLGYLLRDDQFSLPERHLGLIPAQEDRQITAVIDSVARAVAQTIDLERLWQIAAASPSNLLPQKIGSSIPKQVRIAVAQDEAFTFTYPENLELLADAGAEIIPFSPLRDTAVPAADGVMLVGGFPELYAEQLSRNRPMLDSLRAIAGQIPIYAECGGLMYLTEGIVGQDGRFHEMAGLLSGNSRMTPKVTLGYRTVTALVDHPLIPQGASVRGHEFHYSVWDSQDEEGALYEVQARSHLPAHQVGVGRDLIYASYIHLHFLAYEGMAERFIAWASAKFRSS